MIELHYHSLSTSYKRYTSYKIAKLLGVSPQEIQDILEKENYILTQGVESTIISTLVLNQIQKHLLKRNHSIN